MGWRIKAHSGYKLLYTRNGAGRALMLAITLPSHLPSARKL